VYHQGLYSEDESLESLMGKRSNFERNERDFYPTPREAVYPLLPFVRGTTFYEPCCGDGALIDHLCGFGLDCVGASDIEPLRKGQVRLNALELEESDLKSVHSIITNPPWERPLLHAMIERFRNLRNTWLLFDADWMHTRQSSEHMKYCSRIVSIGRVRWIPGSASVGKDNCCWYEFQKDECNTRFIGR
jgi:Predicted DNA modification methylase